MQLEGKIAVITGGGRGLGKGIALTFAAEGSDVVIAARTETALKETAAEIEAMGRKCLAIVTDQSVPEQVRNMVDRTLERFGRVDVLVNNAGIGGPTLSVADMDLEAWKQTLAINLTGAMLCTKYILKDDMIPRRSGNIINISSVSGRRGHANRSPYSVSKWGLIGLTQSLALEVGKYGIRVNCISRTSSG
jgi:NAD(P)-dependent dehydrogenase (short-subunit alcohol dehydrogenase family)